MIVVVFGCFPCAFPASKKGKPPLPSISRGLIQASRDELMTPDSIHMTREPVCIRALATTDCAHLVNERSAIRRDTQPMVIPFGDRH